MLLPDGKLQLAIFWKSKKLEFGKGKNAIEVDGDARWDGNRVFIAWFMEHIEEAGIHSGDSACVVPTQSLSKNILNTL